MLNPTFSGGGGGSGAEVDLGPVESRIADTERRLGALEAVPTIVDEDILIVVGEDAPDLHAAVDLARGYAGRMAPERSVTVRLPHGVTTLEEPLLIRGLRMPELRIVGAQAEYLSVDTYAPVTIVRNAAGDSPNNSLQAYDVTTSIFGEPPAVGSVIVLGGWLDGWMMEIDPSISALMSGAHRVVATAENTLTYRVFALDHAHLPLTGPLTWEAAGYMMLESYVARSVVECLDTSGRAGILVTDSTLGELDLAISVDGYSAGVELIRSEIRFGALAVVGGSVEAANAVGLRMARSSAYLRNFAFSGAQAVVAQEGSDLTLDTIAGATSFYAALSAYSNSSMNIEGGVVACGYDWSRAVLAGAFSRIRSRALAVGAGHEDVLAYDGATVLVEAPQRGLVSSPAVGVVGNGGAVVHTF